MKYSQSALNGIQRAISRETIDLEGLVDDLIEAHETIEELRSELSDANKRIEELEEEEAS